jgi:triosephosphate isomerase
VIAPPALYLQLAQDQVKQENVQVSAQNVYDKPNGAFTGEISVAQLKDSEVHWTILGHSERRTILGETDEVVASKTKSAIDGGVSVVWCCGESLEEREAGNTVAVVERQLAALAAKISGDDWKKIVIAYEPIWAIGTGKVATVQQAQEVHEAIRKWLKAKVSDAVAEETRILYGGSVNGKNCKDLAKEKDIDGFLVGGASLKPECMPPQYQQLPWMKANRTSCRHHQLQSVSVFVKEGAT